MSKRINAVEAIETLSADTTLEIQEKKAVALAKIPDPTFETLPWEFVVQDRRFNVRDDDSYSVENNRELYESLKALGQEIRGGDNMSFSVQPDGKSALTLSGNLRYTMMQIIRNEVAKERETTNPGSTDPLPFSTVFGLVFRGLSRDQEVTLMTDHTMKKKLNEFELCKEVAESMYHNRLTDEAASIKFGLKKSTISRYRMRYAMPVVFDEYRKEKSGKPDVPYIKVGQVALTKLYTSYLADQEAGCKFRECGANFRMAWEIIKKDPEAIGTKPVVPKSLDREKILNQVATFPATFGTTPEVQAISDALNWAGNGDKPVNVQAVIESIKGYCDGLRAEVETLRAEVETLRADRDEWKARHASLSADFDGLTSELAEVKASKGKKS